MPLQNIFDDCGLSIDNYHHVHGGDINEAYCLFERDAEYFLKVNDATRYAGMFEKEMNGLNALRISSMLTIPEVIKCGTADHRQYLLLEWIEKGSPKKDFWERFGEGLALMHKQHQLFFGWEEDNYIGSLHQRNKKYDRWDLFYAECRIMPLAMQLAESNLFSTEDIEATERLCEKLENLFPNEPAALLHGDLWAGNFMIASNGYAAIFDPAVYCGHREMDIGMTKLFGGFDQRFYHAYEEVYPLEKNWKKRLQLTQLYPLLVHAILFGGHYVEQAKTIIRYYGA
jgi:protein-ribulosamine 3-kinase